MKFMPNKWIVATYQVSTTSFFKKIARKRKYLRDSIGYSALLKTYQYLLP